MTEIPFRDGMKNDLPGMYPRAFTPNQWADQTACEATRARLDRALAIAQERPDVPQAGQSPEAYRVALLTRLQKHSDANPTTDLAALSPDGLARVEKTIIDSVLREPERKGELRSYSYTDGALRRVTEWHGSPAVWMDRFKAQGHVSAIHINGEKQYV